MMFEALVINTDTFFERGTIVIRIPEAYFKQMQWDLTDNFPDFMNDGHDGEKNLYDFEAYVYSPYGGGSNFGTVFIPQVNQRGLVVSMDNQLKKLIWLGSFFQPTRDKDWKVEKVNYPSDDMNKEGPNGYGVMNGEQNLLADSLEEAKQKNFVARFKTTDKSTKEGLAWEDRPTSNIVSIGDNSFFVTHFSKGEGWEEHTPKMWTTYSMSKDEDDKDITELKRKDVDSEKEQRMAIAFVEGKESFITEIKNDKDSKYSKLLQQEDGINIEVSDNGVSYSLSLSAEDEEIKIIVNGDNEIVINKDGLLTVNLKEIDITTENNIEIKPGGIVEIGSGGGTLAKYKELVNIIKKLEKHIHVSPTGPTTPPLESSMAPIPPGIMQDKRNMETKKIKSE